jgi:3'-phosphoadenosine 5'-phosphosulfate sulfotransferase (PAPS reductase)/FAD synthetase
MGKGDSMKTAYSPDWDLSTIPQKQLNYCGLSGGKDSSATMLWLIHESGLDRSTFRFTFCDTGNENDHVYRHIELISDRVQSFGCAPVVTLKPERNFLELAQWKNRFPSRKARFCTQHLKVIPTREDVQQFIRSDYEVTVHSGVRAGESPDRAKLVERGFSDMFGCTVNRPLLRLSLADVVEMHRRYDMPLNPLYGLGFTRVGCFPCINSNKNEIKLISIHFPERIDQLRVDERSIKKPGAKSSISTFFQRKTVPPRFRSLEVETQQGPMMVCTIDDVVRWSHTGPRAGRKKHVNGISRESQPLLIEDLFDDDKTLVCPSGAGMCE